MADRFAPLRVVARGMCCAVGHHTWAAAAAINARINHFRETEFIDRQGQPIVGGALHEVDLWGADRLALMLSEVVHECLSQPQAPLPASVALLVLMPEPDRPGMPRSHVAGAIAARLGAMGFHVTSRVCLYGKAGIAQALHDASTLLQHTEGPSHVLLVGLDSLLDAAAIEAGLAGDRIATGSNADGLIPAEGAGALLLSVEASDDAALWIDSAAHADDPWRLGGDEPLRAQGLSRAIRDAVREAGTELAALDFQASGMTGEGWYAKEASLALSRCMERRKEHFAHHMVGQFTGETGAASAALTLAWLSSVMGRDHLSPGQSALLHFAADDGRRAAMVVRYRTSAPADAQGAAA